MISYITDPCYTTSFLKEEYKPPQIQVLALDQNPTIFRFDEVLDKIGQEKGEVLYCGERDYQFEAKGGLDSMFEIDQYQRQIIVQSTSVQQVGLHPNALMMKVKLVDYPHIEE